MHVGIAGAGILGRLLCLNLCHAGFQVSLFDQDDKTGKKSCSVTAAGMMAPFAEIVTANKMIVELGLRSLKIWPSILAQLNYDIFFQQNGSLLITHPRDYAEIENFIKRLQYQLGHSHCIKRLTPLMVKNLEPELTHFHHVYYLEQEGHIDNVGLFKALRSHFQKQKNKMHWLIQQTITEIGPHYLVANNVKHHFDWVFDCRGLGAKQTFKNLRGIRGEAVLVHAPEVKITRPVRFMHPRYPLYVVPRPNSNYIIGASEIECEDHSPISVRTALELLSALYNLHSGFAEARILQTLTNCRPTLADNLPSVLHMPGFIAINGLYRHGFLIAPVLVEEVVALVKNGPQAMNFPHLLVGKKND